MLDAQVNPKFVRTHGRSAFASQPVELIVASVERDGFAIVSQVVPNELVSELTRELLTVLDACGGSARPHGVRNLASLTPGVRRLADSGEISALVGAILKQPGRLVRSILFDKVPGANWKVGWHQDLTIAVEARRDVGGFGPWTTKAGITSVQPPAAVLESMITIRVHLDACGPDNGPVRVIPGSHRHGRLTAEQIDELVAAENPGACSTEAGDALIMRPLLLHASSRATLPAHRRVVHLDFAGVELPGGLRWSDVA